MGPERILPAPQFAFTSDPNNDGRASNDNTYAIGDEVLVQVTFSTDVTVTGSPRLELNVGGGDGKPASYSGVNGASRLLFSYTVVEGHEDTNGISINANKLTHNGATIVDAADSTKNAVPVRLVASRMRSQRNPVRFTTAARATVEPSVAGPTRHPAAAADETP